MPTKHSYLHSFPYLVLTIAKNPTVRKHKPTPRPLSPTHITWKEKKMYKNNKNKIIKKNTEVESRVNKSFRRNESIKITNITKIRIVFFLSNKQVLKNTSIPRSFFANISLTRQTKLLAANFVLVGRCACLTMITKLQIQSRLYQPHKIC